jgi:hypothetical protein
MKQAKPAQAPEPTITISKEQYQVMHNIWSSLEGVVSMLKNSNKNGHYDAYQALRPILEEFNELFEDLPIIQSTQGGAE